jgi:hypothetical protein
VHDTTHTNCLFRVRTTNNAFVAMKTSFTCQVVFCIVVGDSVRPKTNDLTDTFRPVIWEILIRAQCCVHAAKQKLVLIACAYYIKPSLRDSGKALGNG